MSRIYSTGTSPKNHNADTEQKQDDRNAVDAVHHAQIHIRRMIGVGFAEHAQEVRKHRPDFEVI